MDRSPPSSSGSRSYKSRSSCSLLESPDADDEDSNFNVSPLNSFADLTLHEHKKPHMKTKKPPADPNLPNAMNLHTKEDKQTLCSEWTTWNEFKRDTPQNPKSSSRCPSKIELKHMVKLPRKDEPKQQHLKSDCRVQKDLIRIEKPSKETLSYKDTVPSRDSTITRKYLQEYLPPEKSFDKDADATYTTTSSKFKIVKKRFPGSIQEIDAEFRDIHMIRTRPEGKEVHYTKTTEQLKAESNMIVHGRCMPRRRPQRKVPILQKTGELERLNHKIQRNVNFLNNMGCVNKCFKHQYVLGEIEVMRHQVKHIQGEESLGTWVPPLPRAQTPKCIRDRRSQNAVHYKSLEGRGDKSARTLAINNFYEDMLNTFRQRAVDEDLKHIEKLLSEERLPERERKKALALLFKKPEPIRHYYMDRMHIMKEKRTADLLKLKERTGRSLNIGPTMSQKKF